MIFFLLQLVGKSGEQKAADKVKSGADKAAETVEDFREKAGMHFCIFMKETII